MINANLARLLPLLPLLWTLCGCAAVTPYYRTSYMKETPVPEEYHADLLDLVEEALKSGKIRALSADTGAGPQPVYPQPKGAQVPLLDLLPLPAVVALADALLGGMRGAEVDQLIPESNGQLVPVTVTWELDNRIALRIGPALAPSLVVPSAEDLREQHGVTLEDTDRKWAPEELRTLELALQRLSPEERVVAARVIFRRRGPSDCGEKDASGCYQTRGPSSAIILYDSAFAADRHSFVGDVQAPLPASVAVVLHELGHAIDDAARAALRRELAEAVEPYQALRERLNSAQDRVRPVAARLNRLAAHLKAGAPAQAEERARMERQYRDLERVHAALREDLSDLERQHSAGRGRIVDLLQRLRHASRNHQVLRDYERARAAALGPTDYDRKDLSQSFAESFALFRADPQALLRVHPRVHAWFAAGGHIQAMRADLNPPAVAAQRPRRHSRAASSTASTAAYTRGGALSALASQK